MKTTSGRVAVACCDGLGFGCGDGDDVASDPFQHSLQVTRRFSIVFDDQCRLEIGRDGFCRHEGVDVMNSSRADRARAAADVD